MTIVLGIISVLCFIGSFFLSRDSHRKSIRIASVACFAVALVLHVTGLCKSFKNDQMVSDLASQVEDVSVDARQNTLAVDRARIWQNMELTTKEFTGSYSAHVFFKESIPGKPLGRVRITAKSDRACGLSLNCSGDHVAFDESREGMTTRTISFDAGKPPLRLSVHADSPAVITITGSHNIAKYTLEFDNSLPSQLSPKEL